MSYSVKDIRQHHAMDYAPWSDEDDARLLARYATIIRTEVSAKKRIELLAQEFGRKPGAIQSRLRKFADSGRLDETLGSHLGKQRDFPAAVFKRKPQESTRAEALSSAPVIDLNPAFVRALNLLEHSRDHVFITGRAGTGKSTLLSYFRAHTERKVVVLAPTGVAAVNVSGQTIHSFFGFKPNITVNVVKKMTLKGDPKLYQTLDIIIIDEVSMVRADLMDCAEEFLRRFGPRRGLSFGGVQMAFIGDLYQLPPVVTADERHLFKDRYASPYFFSADAFAELTQLPLNDSGRQRTFHFVELETVYRQRDDRFISLLNAIRNNTVTDEFIDELNKRCWPTFSPPSRERYMTLTTTNAMADAVNNAALAKLKNKAMVSRAIIEGAIDQKLYPAEEYLTLKAGAQVMFLNNDTRGRWVNGTVGEIIALGKTRGGEAGKVQARLSGGEIVTVEPYRWDIYSFIYNKEERGIIAEAVGAFIQYPLRLAWAVTIHKSQGKTFERVIIDLGRGTFAPGQLYVALSRCTALEGLVLRRPMRKRDVFIDWQIVKFMTKLQYRIAADHLPDDERQHLILAAIKNSTRLKITYLKSSDEKSRRVITPRHMGEMEFKGVTYLGLDAYCHERRADRIFRVDRILEIEAV